MIKSSTNCSLSSIKFIKNNDKTIDKQKTKQMIDSNAGNYNSNEEKSQTTDKQNDKSIQKKVLKLNEK